MGFLGLFGKKTGAEAVRRHAERVANKRAQQPDRWESIQVLGAMGTVEAVEALLPRFAFYVEPGIHDGEEKEAAFQAIVRAGEKAIPAVRAFLRKSESVSWPLKILTELMSVDAVTGELVDLLSTMDTEYARDPQRKLQVLAELEERHDPRIVGAVRRFLDDVNETARFHAAGAILVQDEADEAREDLLKQATRDESVRVRARILDAAATREWPLGEHREAIQKGMPAGFAIDSKGIVRKR